MFASFRWFPLDMTNSMITTFIGILATFIVVGQYAQVTEVKNEFSKQLKIVKKEIQEEVKKEAEKNNAKLWYGIYSQRVFSICNNQSVDEKDKWDITYHGIRAMYFAYKANRKTDLADMADIVKKHSNIKNGFVSKKDADCCLNILRDIKVDNNDNINIIFRKISELFVKGCLSEKPEKSLIGEWSLTNPTLLTRGTALFFKEDGFYNWGDNWGDDFWCLEEDNKVLRMWAGSVHSAFEISFSEDKNELTLTNKADNQDKRIYKRKNP
ncbi:hypothetical protein AGMMS49965_01930 [Bacteroidia bacterium]|nr:hypothetical protein AGMMS49965_01930 [Bacteroidia bacterium]